MSSLAQKHHGCAQSSSAAPTWAFEQINFVMDNRGSVVEGVISTPSLKSMMYEKERQTDSLQIM